MGPLRALALVFFPLSPPHPLARAHFTTHHDRCKASTPTAIICPPGRRTGALPPRGHALEQAWIRISCEAIGADGWVVPDTTHGLSLNAGRPASCTWRTAPAMRAPLVELPQRGATARRRHYSGPMGAHPARSSRRLALCSQTMTRCFRACCP